MSHSLYPPYQGAQVNAPACECFSPLPQILPKQKLKGNPWNTVLVFSLSSTAGHRAPEKGLQGANSSLFQSWSLKDLQGALGPELSEYFLTGWTEIASRVSTSRPGSTLIVIAWISPCPDVNFSTFRIGNYTASTLHFTAPGAFRCCLCKSATVGTAQEWPKSSSWFTHLLCSLGLPGSCCCSDCS